MTPQTLVRFASPISLRLAVRSRFSSTPDETHTQTFSALPIWVQIDASQRTITAYLSPIPRGILLYAPADFSAASADSMDDHCERVLAMLGSDPATSLQALIDGRSMPNPSKRVPREIANWRAKAILAGMGKLAEVDALIAAMPEPDGTVMRLAWGGNAALSRFSKSVVSLATSLGMDPAAIDALFIDAEALVL